MSSDEDRAARQALQRHFVDLVDGKFSVLLLSKVRALNTVEPDGEQIVKDFIEAVRGDDEACGPNFTAVLNAVTAKRQPDKLEHFREALNDPGLGTPITIRVRNRIAYVVEQNVDVELVDQLTRAVIERFQRMVGEPSP